MYIYYNSNIVVKSSREFPPNESFCLQNIPRRLQNIPKKGHLPPKYSSLPPKYSSNFLIKTFMKKIFSNICNYF